MRFRTRALAFEAIRFDGENAAEVEAFIRESVAAPVEWERNPRRPIVPTPRGNAMCNVGEYVVRINGGVYPCSPKLVEALMEPDDR
jgi:hypothetical protein